MDSAMKAWLFGLFFCIICLAPGQSQAGFTDYEKHPVLDFHFSHLDAVLSLDSATRSVSGIATYNVAARHTFADTLELHATGLNISSVLINNQEADFEYADNRLRIRVTEYVSDPIRPFELSISYSAERTQALLKTAAGTLFTSMAPNRRSEWIPIMEHPRVAFTTRLTLEVDASLEVVSNGQYFRTRTLDNGRKQVLWRSEVPIPSTDLTFVVGNLQFTETLLGLTSVRVYGEPRTGSQMVREELMREVISSLSQLTRSLRVEYPFEGFSLVMLEDHLWEPRLSVASVGIVAGTISSKKVQIDRLIASQWFGGLLRPETVAGSAAHLLHQAALVQQLEHEAPKLSTLGFPDVEGFPYWDLLLPQHFGFWMDAYTALEPFPAYLLGNHMRTQLRRVEPVGDWPEFERIWYRETGRTFPEPVFDQLRAAPEEDRRLAVQLIYGFSPERGISVTIDPQGPVTADSIRVPLEIHFRGGVVREDTLTVFRTGGEFVIPAETRPVNIIAGDGAPLFRFMEMKDLNMWLHQLQNSESVALRVQAAENLGRFRDDPDIQLAVRDVLRAENHPEVRTALIRAVSSIVRGAAGTQQMFLQIVSTAEGDELLAAVEALRNYPGNAAVVSAIGRLAQSAQYSEAAVLAVRVFREIATEQQFTELASSLLGGSGPAAIRAAVIDELFELPDRMVAVNTSFDIVSMTTFPYLMRATALHALANHNRAPELRELVPQLIDDADPRMRLLALRYIGALEDAQMNNLLEQRYQTERDPRIRMVLQSF